MTDETTGPPVRRGAARLTIPGVAVLLGIGYLVAGLLGGQPGFGVFGLLLMAAVAAGFWWVARHSETAAALRDRNDERINQHDQVAAYVAGMTVLGAVLAMFMVEIARGESGMPYTALGALGGVSYLVTLLWLRLRR
jgi:hypothetical protein